jgi:hypothetical protein
MFFAILTNDIFKLVSTKEVTSHTITILLLWSITISKLVARVSLGYTVTAKKLCHFFLKKCLYQPRKYGMGSRPAFVNYKERWTRFAAASDKVYQLLAHGRWFSPTITSEIVFVTYIWLLTTIKYSVGTNQRLSWVVCSWLNLKFEKFWQLLLLYKKLWNGAVFGFNATFNNISVISWRSVLLMEETGVPRKTIEAAASHYFIT